MGGQVCVQVWSRLVLVTLHVQGQVVGAREAAAAGDTFERFGAGVFPVVSGELVGPGEAPVAVLPRAAIRLLTCETQQEVSHTCTCSHFYCDDPRAIVFLLVRVLQRQWRLLMTSPPVRRRQRN